MSALVVAGCATSATTGGAGTGSDRPALDAESEPTTDSAYEDWLETWTPSSLAPSRDLAVEYKDVVTQDSYNGDDLGWSYNVVGSEYRAIFDSQGSIDISRNDDPGVVVAHIPVPVDTEMYLPGAVFQEHYAYLGELAKLGYGADVPIEKNRVYRLDLVTGDEVEIAPPEGQRWREFADDMVDVQGTLVRATYLIDGSGTCLAEIDGVDASTITCLEGTWINFIDAATDGVSAQIYGIDENLDDCRSRVWISLDGSTQELIGDDDTCYAFDGTRIDGWDIWGRTPQAPGHLRFAYGHVKQVGADEESDIGLVKSGTMRMCGQSVYWVGMEPDEFGQDQGPQYIARWRPGDDHYTKVHDSGGHYSLITLPCSGEVMNADATPLQDVEWQRDFYWTDTEPQ